MKGLRKYIFFFWKLQQNIGKYLRAYNAYCLHELKIYVNMFWSTSQPAGWPYYNNIKLHLYD